MSRRIAWDWRRRAPLAPAVGAEWSVWGRCPSSAVNMCSWGGNVASSASYEYAQEWALQVLFLALALSGLPGISPGWPPDPHSSAGARGVP